MIPAHRWQSIGADVVELRRPDGDASTLVCTDSAALSVCDGCGLVHAFVERDYGYEVNGVPARCVAVGLDLDSLTIVARPGACESLTMPEAA